MTTNRHTVLVQAGELSDALLGLPIAYDGDEPSIYGGQRPADRDGRIVVTLDGREHADCIPDDDVWITPEQADLLDLAP